MKKSAMTQRQLRRLVKAKWNTPIVTVTRHLLQGIEEARKFCGTRTSTREDLAILQEAMTCARRVSRL